MSTRKALNFATHVEAMSTPALIWGVVQILFAWSGFVYFTFTHNTSWQVFFGVYHLGNAIAAVGREVAYRDNKRTRSLFGEVHISGRES